MFFKIKIRVIIYLFIISFCACSQKIDIYNYDFFGFKLSDTYDEVIKTLTIKKLKYDAEEIGIFSTTKPMLLLRVKNEKGEELPYSIKFYEKKVVNIINNNLSKNDIDKFIKIFGKDNLIKNSNNLKNVLYKWNFNDEISISIKEQYNKYNLVIQNNKIQNEANEFLNKENKLDIYIYFIPKIDNLRFRETPKLDSKFIRMLTKGEKLELLEKGNEETINGVKGTWVKVKTEKGEIGWCFDAYLEEVK